MAKRRPLKRSEKHGAAPASTAGRTAERVSRDGASSPRLLAGVEAPGVEQVVREARSGVARVFFTSPSRRVQLRELIRKFNARPYFLLWAWEAGARSFIRAARELRGRKWVSEGDLRRLADAFFDAYAPNALSESVRGVKPVDAGIYPPLYEGTLVAQGEGRSEKDALGRASAQYHEYARPFAELLSKSAHSPASFSSAVRHALRGETTAHGRVRLAKPDYEGGERVGRRMMAARQAFASRRAALSVQERDVLDAHELLGRQMAVINEAHSALAQYYAPVVEDLCNKYVKQHRVRDLPAGWHKMWAMKKLAVLSGKLSVRVR